MGNIQPLKWRPKVANRGKNYFIGDRRDIDTYCRENNIQHDSVVIFDRIEKIKGYARGLKVLFVDSGRNYDIDNFNRIIDELMTRDCFVERVK